MLKKFDYFIRIIFSFSLLLVFSCNNNDLSNIVYENNVNQISINSKYQNDFISNAKKYGVNLTEGDLNSISRLTRVVPTGEWTPGPENNSKANMTKHFIKHGKEFKPAFKSEIEYLEAAIAFSKDKSNNSKYYFDTAMFKSEKILSVVKWNSKTSEFLVVRENGQIATYFLDKKINTSRFVYVPSEL